MESPCTGCCFYDHEKDRCTACFRTLEEIGAWSRLTAKEKKKVVEKCQRRGGHPAGSGACLENK